jgi:uncharacterized protein YjbI with pentapeptide repeats
MKFTPILLALQFATAILLAQSSTPAADTKTTLANGLQTNLSGSRFYQVSLANAQFDQSDLSKTTF